MDRNTLASLASQIKTKEDYLSLLNQLKLEEGIRFEQSWCMAMYHPFTINHLNYYCNPENEYHRYRRFKIKKKTGGYRLITSPNNYSYKALLHYTNEILKSLYTPTDYAMGFTEGRSVVSNAKVHVGQRYVFNIDIKDFFSNIYRSQVTKRLTQKPFNFPSDVAYLIAGICCMKVKKEKEVSYVLPQGFPTSPILTNMVCDNLDYRLAGLAKKHGLNYTRYADDITFSSMHNVYYNGSYFRKKLDTILTAYSFKINDKKTRLQKQGSRQEVTGIIVGEKLNVTQKYVRDIRNILFIWERYGYSVANSRFFEKYKAEKGHVKKGTPNMANVISGKLQYLRMVKGCDDSVYQRLHSKFTQLLKREYPQGCHSKVHYVETMPISTFEEKTRSEVVIKINKCNGSRLAYFLLGEEKTRVYIKSDIPNSELNKENLMISHCMDLKFSKDKPFWFIHYPYDYCPTLHDIETEKTLQQFD